MGLPVVEGDEVADGRAEEGDAAVGDGEGGRARRWEMRRPAMEREVGRPIAGRRREMGRRWEEADGAGGGKRTGGADDTVGPLVSEMERGE